MKYILIFLIIIFSSYYVVRAQNDYTEWTLDDFESMLKEDMDFRAVVKTFGEPVDEIGSGIYILVYKLADSTNMLIGCTHQIIYAYHIDEEGNKNYVGDFYSDSKFEIEIKLNEDTVSSFDSIKIEINVINISTEKIRILFDKPAFYTGGLWLDYRFNLINSLGNNMLEAENRAFLASVTSPKFKELKKHEYTIKPGQSITKEFMLNKLVSIKQKDIGLKDGKYELVLKNKGVFSNVEEFVILDSH